MKTRKQKEKETAQLLKALEEIGERGLGEVDQIEIDRILLALQKEDVDLPDADELAELEHAEDVARFIQAALKEEKLELEDEQKQRAQLLLDELLLAVGVPVSEVLMIDSAMRANNSNKNRLAQQKIQSYMSRMTEIQRLDRKVGHHY